MTAMSLLVPLVVVMLAFALLGDEDLVPDAELGWSDWFSVDGLLGAWRIWVSGIFVGLTSEYTCIGGNVGMAECFQLV